MFSAEDSAEEIDPEQLKQSLMSSSNGHLSELLQAAEGPLQTAPKTQPVELVYDESVECPACGKAISAEAASCPHCGVEFEVEEVFECPMCKSLVDIHVNKCPSCGTEFADDDAETPPETKIEAAPPPPEPKPEPKREPTSFVERLKQIKDEPTAAPAPAAEPKKELSFAERMKAMKSEKPQEPVQAPAQTKSSVPTKQPTPEPSRIPQATAVNQTPPVQKEAVPPSSPEKKEGNIAERMKSLKEGVSAGQKAAAAPPAAKPVSAPPVQVTAPPAESDAAKRDAYKELPQYIGDVKKLLILASELKLDVSTSKAQINKAVTAGKTRDLDNAIRLVKDGKAGLERDIRAALHQKVRTLETALSLEKKAGREITAQERSLNEIKTQMELNDFSNASEEIKKIETQMSKTSTTQISAAEIETVSCAIGDAESLNLNVSEARGIYQAALKAAEAKDINKSSELSKQALETLNKILPSYIAGEMRKAKITLREIKMMNVDITLPVNLLKEANDHVLVGDYCAALGSIRKFKEFVERAQS